MQTHCLPRPLSETRFPEKEARVFFSIATPSRAVIFIHGYSGDPIKTWSNFHGLLPGRTGFQGSDIYFYGYDGVKSDMYSSASIFKNFVERLLDDTRSITSVVPPFINPRDKYDEILIVAHSLGAVIARRALVDAAIEEKEWPKKISLILYAPAHMGANIVALVSDTISGWPLGKLIGNLARLKSPLIDQLKPESNDLIILEKDTRKKISDGFQSCLIAKKVFIAEYESVVENKTFCNDPPPKSIPGTTHTTVCKPRISFLAPLYALEECL